MKEQIRIMRFTLIFSTSLMLIKFAAWWLTNSNAIFTDALESIVNVAAGTFALYSITYAARPRDEDHPYGHGKIEFVSAGFEGALILLAGGWILFESIKGFWFPHEISRPDIGAALSFVSGAANFLVGRYLIKRGRKEQSSLMQANGKHLVSDTISSIGLVAGMLLIYFTKITWIDNALAIVFGGYIIFTGYQLVREALGNLLDEQDQEKIKQLIKVLNDHRKPNWIDMHNLRVLKYGSGLHVDAHITLPWYLSLEEAHTEVDHVEQLVKKAMGEEMEFFIHADPCLPTSCSICPVATCPHRKSNHEKNLQWTMENMLPDKKHSLLS
jgi:cation diffusion facilitator family transporter